MATCTTWPEPRPARPFGAAGRVAYEDEVGIIAFRVLVCRSRTDVGLTQTHLGN